MEEAKRVSVHVADWNDPAALDALLDSLEGQTVAEYQAVVVDDSSGEGEGITPERHPSLVRLRNFRRAGYARAHNQAIAFALSRWPAETLSERFVVFIDPHVQLAPDAFEHLLRAFRADPELMVAGPKVYAATRAWSEVDERQVIEPTDRLESAGFLLRKSRRPVRRGFGEQDKGQYDAAPDVFGFPEDFLMVRASALASASLLGEWLDPELHRGQELVDLCWRFQWLGFRARLVPAARIYRYARDGARLDERLAWRERNRLESKNDTLVARLPHLPWTAVDAWGFWLRVPLHPSLLVERVASWFPSRRLAAQRKELFAKRKRTSSQMRRLFV